MKPVRLFLLIYLMFAYPAEYIFAQKYIVDTYEVIVYGSSNIHHDWTVKVEDMNGYINVGNNGNEIDKINILVNAKTLKSSKGSIMDKKMQSALKTGKYPVISYATGSKSLLPNKNVSNKITTNGVLTISGVAKNVTISGICKIHNNEITVIGMFELQMTDYGIKPPTAFFGTLITTDKVKIIYKITFQRI